MPRGKCLSRLCSRKEWLLVVFLNFPSIIWIAHGRTNRATESERKHNRDAVSVPPLLLAKLSTVSHNKGGTAAWTDWGQPRTQANCQVYCLATCCAIGEVLAAINGMQQIAIVGIELGRVWANDLLMVCLSWLCVTMTSTVWASLTATIPSEIGLWQHWKGLNYVSFYLVGMHRCIPTNRNLFKVRSCKAVNPLFRSGWKEDPRGSLDVIPTSSLSISLWWLWDTVRITIIAYFITKPETRIPRRLAQNLNKGKHCYCGDRTGESMG